MRQSFGALRRRVTPKTSISLVEEQFGQIRAVLAGDSGDERALGHDPLWQAR